MGLHSQLNDVSSDSIPLLFLALVAKSVDHLRSFFLSLFHSISLFRFDPPQGVVDDGFFGSIGSGLSGVILLSEQLKINRILSYSYCCAGDDFSRGGSDCMFCLSTLKDGEQVRKLDCRHVFHKECFDGWLDHLNFNCPLCRSPLVSDERVNITWRRVGEDLVDWFSVR